MSECPTGKRAYSRRSAGEAKNRSKSNYVGVGRKKRKKIPQRCYQCPECGQWHLSSKPWFGGE